MKFKVDNTLDCYGMCDTKTKEIRINISRHKRYFKKKKAYNRALLDTFIHEILHARYPKKKEPRIQEETQLILQFLTKEYQGYLLKGFKGRLHT